MLSTTDVAEKLNVSTKTVKRWIEDGKLIAYRFGKDYRISQDDFEKFVEQSKVNNQEH